MNGLMEAGTYKFDETGKMVIISEDDVVSIEEIGGSLYYCVNGNPVAVGMVEVDGDYYYAAEGGKIVTGKYYCTETNDLFKADTNYTFGDDGKMLQGLVWLDGTLWYYVNGKISYAGLIEADGAYYYIKGSGKAVVNGSYSCTKMNGYMEEGTYSFDAEGKLIR